MFSETQQSTHYVLHYTLGDGVDVPHTGAFYVWISGRLSVDLGTQIQYFKFENVQQKQGRTGEGGNGNADASADSIYTIWPSENHETTHILTYRIGYPTAFFNEGIAVANEVDPLGNSYRPMWHGTPVHECAKQLLAAGTLPALADIVETNAFWDADQNITYPAACSFVEYLTEQYGLQKVLQLFPGASYQDSLAVVSARFQQVFGFSLETAERGWHTFL